MCQPFSGKFYYLYRFNDRSELPELFRDLARDRASIVLLDHLDGVTHLFSQLGSILMNRQPVTTEAVAQDVDHPGLRVLRVTGGLAYALPVLDEVRPHDFSMRFAIRQQPLCEQRLKNDKTCLASFRRRFQNLDP